LLLHFLGYLSSQRHKRGNAFSKKFPRQSNIIKYRIGGILILPPNLQ
jgi:hypothetical protein